MLGPVRVQAVAFWIVQERVASESGAIRVGPVSVTRGLRTVTVVSAEPVPAELLQLIEI